MVFWSGQATPEAIEALLVWCVMNGSTIVVLNLRAGTFCSNSKSSSAYVLPFGSGRRKKVQMKQMKQVPAKKKPDLAPQFQAVGLSIRGVMTLMAIPVMLYRFRANTTLLARRRVDDNSDTKE